MKKECLECNMEIIDIQEIYVEGIEVCPYCFTILDIPIIEKNIINKDLIDTITSQSILNQLLSNLDSEKPISVSMILLCVFLGFVAVIFPLIVSLFV